MNLCKLNKSLFTNMYLCKYLWGLPGNIITYKIVHLMSNNLQIMTNVITSNILYIHEYQIVNIWGKIIKIVAIKN